MSVKLSIVIPAKNEEKHIQLCVESLIAQTFPPQDLEIIVVDNASTDGTWEILKRYAESGKINLYRFSGKTIASVRNYGASKGKGNILVFLDSDCVVPKNMIEAGVEILTTHSNVGCVGFKNTQPTQDASWVEKAWSCISSTSKYSGTKYVDWLSSFNLILWKHIFAEVGGFNEAMLTCEDVDFGYKLGKRYKLMISDQITVQHLGESKTLKEFFKREFWRGSSNLKQCFLIKNIKREILSVTIPVAYLVAIFFLIALNGYNLFNPNLQADKLIGLSLIILALPPTLLAFWKTNQKNNIKIILGIILLSFIYLITRGLAVFRAWK